jgi:predicted transposase YdaD
VPYLFAEIPRALLVCQILNTLRKELTKMHAEDEADYQRVYASSGQPERGRERGERVGEREREDVLTIKE